MMMKLFRNRLQRSISVLSFLLQFLQSREERFDSEDFNGSWSDSDASQLFHHFCESLLFYIFLHSSCTFHSQFSFHCKSLRWIELKQVASVLFSKLAYSQFSDNSCRKKEYCSYATYLWSWEASSLTTCSAYLTSEEWKRREMCSIKRSDTILITDDEI